MVVISITTTYTGDGDGGIAEKEELIEALHTVHVSGVPVKAEK